MLAQVQIEPSEILAGHAAAFERALERRLRELQGVPERLAEAMQYSLLGGGKRLRPVMAMLSCEACGGQVEAAIAPAIALECVHVFSLVHDDLPALDNDELRRGRASCHVKFGESTAILAGDALLALAFEVLASDIEHPITSVMMARELAVATGATGMIGGEFMDLAGESHVADSCLTARIHEAKTARLFEAACRLGAIAATAPAVEADVLAKFGRLLGLAFQGTDDILDVIGSPETTGKATGKDEASGKQTLPRAIGLEASRERVASLTREAIESLAPLGDRGRTLASVARHLVERTH